MKTAALFLLAAALTAGYAAANDSDADSLDKALTQAASTLETRSDADSLAAAALLTRLKDGTRAEQLAARASAAAPKRPELLWLHAQLCGDVSGCDRKPIDAQLHELDPENAAVYLPALAGPRVLMQTAETDRLLAAAAAGKR